MSTDADKITACPSTSDLVASDKSEVPCETTVKNWKKSRRVRFPEDESHLVTEYFEPANPWQSVDIITPDELADKYEESCQHHGIEAISGLVEQIKAFPHESLQCEQRREGVGVAPRLPRLKLSGAALSATQADALEAVLRRVQFRRIDLDDCAMDDETAVALFDMIEYYESATILNISGNREFGIRGWQACSRMMKKSQSLWEVEARDTCVGQAHAPVLCRALRPASCRLRALRLPRASLAGQPLVCLVGALKQNRSVRELQVCDNGLTPDDAAQLAALLRCNSSLQLLDLSNNQIQDAGMQHLAEGLSEQSHTTVTSPHSDTSPTGSEYEKGLAVLVLWNNQLTRNSANALSRALASSRSLCVLNVGANAVGCEGVRGMAGALLGGGALLCLGLQAARLAAPAAKAIADVLQHNTTLQRIDLRDNRLAVCGLRVLASAMHHNSTITQIDLDDVVEPHPTNVTHHDTVAYEGGVAPTVTSPIEEERAEAARLTSEIRAKCRHNEVTPHATPPPPPAPARKISLTCQTLHRPIVHNDTQKPSSNVLELRNSPETRRLRSPLPSPIPSPLSSPTPRGRANRFQVSRVQSDVGSSTDTESTPSPTTPPSNLGVSPRQAFFATPDIPATPAMRVDPKNSRFRVIHVTETPNSQTPNLKTSETKKRASSTPLPAKATSRFSVSRNYDSAFDVTATVPAVRSDAVLVNVGTDSKLCNDETDNVTSQRKVFCDLTAVKTVETNEQTNCNNAKNNNVEVVWKNQTNAPIINLEGKPLDFLEGVFKTGGSEEILLRKNDDGDIAIPDGDDSSVTYAELDKRKVQIAQNAKKELFAEEKKSSDSDPMREIAAITEGLGNLIREMKDMSDKTSLLIRKPSDGAKNFSNKRHEKDEITPLNIVNVELTDDRKSLTKNRSESSLDSSDLEVSKYMQHKNRAFYDSSSSLEVSGSSVESLNTLENIEAARRSTVSQSVTFEIGNTTLTKDSHDERKAKYLSPSSTESSVEWNAEVPVINQFLPPNASFSSNDSVSPNPFGKHVKLHGSLSSLEASVGSIDLCRTSEISFNEDKSDSSQMTESTTTSKDLSSNEGTLTNDSKLLQFRNTLEKDATESDVSETVTATNLRVANDNTGPRRTNSEIHIPEKTERVRKCSWVAPTANFSIPKPTDPNISASKDTQIQKVEKVPTNLEKLLSLFQHPGSLFSRSISGSSQDDKDEKTTSNVNFAPSRKESAGTSGFWSWNINTSSDNKNQTVLSPNIGENTENIERVQKSYVDDALTRSFSNENSSYASEKKAANNSETNLSDRLTSFLSDVTTTKNPTERKSVQHANKTESQNKNFELENKNPYIMSENEVTNLADKEETADKVQILEISKSDIIDIKNDIIVGTNNQINAPQNQMEPETKIGESEICDLKIDISEPETNIAEPNTDIDVTDKNFNCKNSNSGNETFSEHKTNNNEPRRDINELQINISRTNIGETNRNTKEEFSEREKDITESNRDISESTRDVCDPQKVVGESNRDISESIRVVSESKRDISESRRDISESKRDISESRRDISESKTEISESRRDISESRRDISESKRDISESKTEISESRRDISESRRDTSESRRDISELRRDICDSNRDLSESNRDMGEPQRYNFTPNSDISKVQTCCEKNVFSEIQNSDKTSDIKHNLRHCVTDTVSEFQTVTSETKPYISRAKANITLNGTLGRCETKIDTSASETKVRENSEANSDPSDKLTNFSDVIESEKYWALKLSDSVDANSSTTGVIDVNVKLVDGNVKIVDKILKLVNDNVKVGDDNVKLVDDDVKLVDDDVKLLDDDVKLVNDDVKLLDDDVKLVDDDVKLVDDYVKLMDDDVKLVDDDVKLVDNDVKLVDYDVILVDNDVKLVDNGVNPVDDDVKLVDGDVKLVDDDVKLVDGDVKLVDGDVKLVDDGVKLVDGDVKLVDDGVKLVDDLKLVDLNVKIVDDGVKVQCDTEEIADLKVGKPYVISSDNFTNNSVDFKLCNVNSRLSLFDSSNETSHFKAINKNNDVELCDTLNFAGPFVTNENYRLESETGTGCVPEDMFDKVLRSMDRNTEVGIDKAISLLSPNRNCEKNDAKAEMGERFEFQEPKTESGKFSLEIPVPAQDRPRTFAFVLKSSEMNTERTNPHVADNSTSVANLSSRIIRGIKENISPENTITLNFTNTDTIVNEMTVENDFVGIENFCTTDSIDFSRSDDETVDVAKDALVLLEYGEHEFEGDTLSPANKMTVPETIFSGLATLDVELRRAERQNSDEKSPELVTDEFKVEEITEYFAVNERLDVKQTDKLVLKRANSLEDVMLSKSPMCKEICLDEIKSGFELSADLLRNQNLCVPNDSSIGCSTSVPKDIPELSSTNINIVHHKAKRRGSNRSSCSPKSLPDTLYQANTSLRLPISEAPIMKLRKKSNKISTLGKIARDSLLALNISEEEIADFKQSHKLRSVDSLRSIESISEASHSGHEESVDYATCIRTSQESLMSLDSISEDCKSVGDCDEFRK